MDTDLLNHIDNARNFIDKTRRLHNPNKKEFLSDEKTYLSVSMTLFTVLNEIIEIGELVIDKEGFKIPLKYSEIFVTLKNENVISGYVGKILEKYCKYRNMIAHQYSHFDTEKIYEISENIDIVEKFIDEILDYYKS